MAPTPGEVKAVIWDFGGVFTTSPFDAFNRYEAERGLPTDIPPEGLDLLLRNLIDLRTDVAVAQQALLVGEIRIALAQRRHHGLARRRRQRDLR